MTTNVLRSVAWRLFRVRAECSTHIFKLSMRLMAGGDTTHLKSISQDSQFAATLAMHYSTWNIGLHASHHALSRGHVTSRVGPLGPLQACSSFDM